MNIRSLNLVFLFLLSLPLFGEVKVTVGCERLFRESEFFKILKGKKIGLITHHSAITCDFTTTAAVFAKVQEFELKAIFSPEHGFYGDVYAYGSVEDTTFGRIPVYSLHGQSRRPTREMLREIDVLVFDIQDIGSRSYSYLSTLFYCMEEAAKAKIPFVVLDRPNPMGGKVIDGCLIDEKCRSFFGYIAIPYCHGMTFGELARLFNEEYQVGCNLTVIPMRGWKREMIFADTGLTWIPTSPQIPESDTPFYYPMTGILGHLSIVSIGVGYTLPFKVIGAPWMDGEKFATAMNKLSLPGVYFHPIFFRPFFGKFKLEPCEGIKIIITDPHSCLPCATGFALLGMLKTNYPKQYDEMLKQVISHPTKKEAFNKLAGKEEIFQMISEKPYFSWQIRSFFQKESDKFRKFRKKFLIKEYES